MVEVEMEFFKVNSEILQQLIATALSRGGDYADVYLEYSTLCSITLRNGSVNAAGNHIDYGVGIRTIKGDQTGYAYAESTDMSQMIRAAKMAAAIADGVVNASASSNIGCVERDFARYYPSEDSWSILSVDRRIEFLRELDRLAREADSRVTNVIARVSDSFDKFICYNSLGELTSDQGPMASVVVNVMMCEGNHYESSTATRSYRMGSEMLTSTLAKELVDEAIKEGAAMFKAKPIKGGEMDVVMAAGGAGILLHEAIGHTFEADFNRKRTSLFCDKLGKRICNSNINVVDDGTIPFNRGAINVDDEGVAGQKTYMVKDGVLNSYLHDRISANHYGVESTGNGRRESFRFYPIPRMRATYMESGDADENSIIASVKNGVYLDSFSNGQVQIGAGDFTFYVKCGYMIENGRLTAPIKDINVIGNGAQVLSDIVAVGNNLKMENGTWTCGKEQSVPVSCGMPTILVSKLRVG